MGSKNLIELAPRAHPVSARPRSSARSADRGLSKYFDETALYWDQIYTGRKFINWHLAHRRQLVLEAVSHISGERKLRVLDLGCGSGVLTRDLLRMGHSVVALDCSEAMIQTLERSLDGDARKRFLGAALGSAGETCFRAAAFDLILCIGVIQYQRQPENVFQEIARLLKPGGTCIFTVPNQLSLHHVTDPWCWLRYIWRLSGRLRCLSQSSPRSWRASFEHPASVKDVYERRYFRREIATLLSSQALGIREAVSFGYGPLTFGNRGLLPDQCSITLSEAITKVAELPALSWLCAFANRWILTVEKPVDPRNGPATIHCLN